MASVDVQVDAKAVTELGANIEAAKRALIGRLAERGYQLLRDEVPVRTGNLKKGVVDPDVDYTNMQATIVVSAARDEGKALVGEVFDKKGDPVKTVTLRPSPAFNYAEAVARGRASIAPKHGKALLIPVVSVPSGEGYLLAGGQIFVFRKSASAVPANPFDERAAARLEQEAPAIADAVLNKFV